MHLYIFIEYFFNYFFIAFINFSPLSIFFLICCNCVILFTIYRVLHIVKIRKILVFLTKRTFGESGRVTRAHRSPRVLWEISIEFCRVLRIFNRVFKKFCK